MAFPFLRAAHLLVSSETRAQRQQLVAALESALAPLVVGGGRVEHVASHDPSELVAGGQLASLIDTNAASLDDEQMRPLVRALHVRQLSNALKHLEALKRVAALPPSGEGGRFALVVEDDAVFGDSMVDALRRAASDAPADAGVVFVGLPSTRLPAPGSTASLFDDPLVLFPGNVLPACESYLVSQEAARRLVEAFLPVRMPTNAQLAYLLRRELRVGAAAPSGPFRSYVAVPNAFADGSKVGITASSIEANNQLVWNQVYCLASELLRSGRADKKQLQRDFEELWQKQPFKDHPDCVVQLADQLSSCGRYGEAQDAYERALKEYGARNCVVNTNSEFMRRYMATYGKV